MRDWLLVYINGTRHEVRQADAFLSLSDYLRLRQGMTGTKIVCSEGDCGACTALVGRPAAEGIAYQGVDSCILFMHQLDRTHVVTIEGLQQDDQLHPLQTSMVDCFGSQCGFCTPGFVTAMAAELESPCSTYASSPRSYEDWQAALTGNLCRCTGYVQILEAALAGADDSPAIEDLYPAADLLPPLTDVEGSSVEIAAHIRGAERTVRLPATLSEAVEFRAAHPECKIISGATDVGVQVNKRQLDPLAILSLSSLQDEAALVATADQISFGCRTTWTQIEHWAEDAWPEFHKIIVRFGSPQIRNASTLVGNIANGSPIADSLPLLFVMNARVELTGADGQREVNINEFYEGYKQLAMRPDELISAVHLPLPEAHDTVRLYKVSKRNDLDISTFTAAVFVELNGAGDDEISDARVALGGVGPTIQRLPKTEAALIGQRMDESLFVSAGKTARGEIQPISDVRGSADYRWQLAENILLKFYFETIRS